MWLLKSGDVLAKDSKPITVGGVRTSGGSRMIAGGGSGGGGGGGGSSKDVCGLDNMTLHKKHCALATS